MKRLTLLLVLCVAVVWLGAQPPAAVFTADQAAAGRVVYEANCASCHMNDLAGRNEAPQLAGANFMNTWRGRTTRDLFEFTQSTMPPTGANLTADQYLAVTAFILQTNGGQAGAQPLTPTTAQPIGRIANGIATASAQVGSGAPGRQAAGAPQTTTADSPGRGGQAGQGSRGATAPAGPLGVTVAGDVKNFVPVTDDMLRNQDPGDWLMARRTYQGWSYSPLAQITKENARELQLQWVWPMNEGQGNEAS